LHAFLSFATSKSKKLAGLLEGSGIQIIKKGAFDKKVIESTSLRKEEILEAARLQAKIEDLSKIDNAFLEANGSISIIPKKE